MEGFPKKVLCISNKNIDKSIPYPAIGSEYTAIGLFQVSWRPGEEWYMLTELVHPQGLYYKPELFSDLGTNIDERELVNEKELTN